MSIILEALSTGARVRDACAKAGLDHAWFYSWKRKYPDFAAKVEVAMESQVGMVEDSLYTQAVNGAGWAVCFFLANKAGHKWKHVQNIQHSGAAGNPIQIAAAANIMAGMTDEQLKEIAAKSKQVSDAMVKAAPTESAPENGPT